MSWFKCKKTIESIEAAPKERKKRTKIFVYEAQIFEVGKTYIELTFSHGGRLIITIYGSVQQSTYNGTDEDNYNSLNEPIVYDVKIKTSLKRAQELVQRSDLNDAVTYVDDIENISKSMTGVVIATAILNTIKHEVSFDVAKLVDKENKNVVE